MTNLELFLKQKFHFSSFKEGQEETITSLLEGSDTFTVLPTGTGKSLCYQLPSYLLEGNTIIVSPLISLMEDQVNQLRRMGEKSVIAINSHLDFGTKQYVLNHLKNFKFIFISPESLNQKEILQRIKALNISLFVVDEAHCISEWGHDFRPSYLALKDILKELQSPRTLALTATATNEVRDDVKHQLFSERRVNEFFYSVDRPNIYYHVENCDNKLAFLKTFFESRNVPSIIYFSSKKEAERICEELRNSLSCSVAFYHGDMQQADRVRIQQQFIHDEIRILCATSAFGMGINKENVRVVIHYHLPDSLENYVQESGRAGRDGEQSLSIILYQEGDERIHRFLQEESFNQKKDLLFLKNKSKIELKSYGNMLTDIQKKWLDQLAQTNWDWETFEQNLNIKQFEKNRKMYSMKNYIEHPNCLRVFILDYFHSQKIAKDFKNCCNHCCKEYPEIVNLPTQTFEETKFNGKELLKNLFLNKF